jgi:TRAP-type C4-dicarboxylate transport system substrate-binding protein
MRLSTLAALACLTVCNGAARAETLRFATIAPEGTAWARELNAFARDVETHTNGAVRVKWYFGGIAGDEGEQLERIRRGQLDGATSGGPMCETLAPSMRALRILGLLTTPAEATTVVTRLINRLAQEFHTHGFVLLGTASVGPHVLFTRRPVRTFDDFKAHKFWVWDKDDVMRLELPLLGVRFEPSSLYEAARAWEQGRVDGFIAPASVALAFQWSALAHYVTELRLDYITACVTVSERTFDALSHDEREALRGAGAKLAARFSDLSTTTDAALLDRLFARQGLQTVPPSITLRSDFHQAAMQARDRLASRITEPALLAQILGILADYRAEHAPNNN